MTINDTFYKALTQLAVVLVWTFFIICGDLAFDFLYLGIDVLCSFSLEMRTIKAIIALFLCDVYHELNNTEKDKLLKIKSYYL